MNFNYVASENLLKNGKKWKEENRTQADGPRNMLRLFEWDDPAWPVITTQQEFFSHTLRMLTGCSLHRLDHGHHSH